MLEKLTFVIIIIFWDLLNTSICSTKHNNRHPFLQLFSLFLPKHNTNAVNEHKLLGFFCVFWLAKISGNSRYIFGSTNPIKYMNQKEIAISFDGFFFQCPKNLNEWKLGDQAEKLLRTFKIRLFFFVCWKVLWLWAFNSVSIESPGLLFTRNYFGWALFTYHIQTYCCCCCYFWGIILHYLFFSLKFIVI